MTNGLSRETHHHLLLILILFSFSGSFWGKAKFEAEVHGACCIIKEVRLQGHLLSDGWADEATNSQ